MLDERHVKDPSKFDPDRLPSDYMLFGHGMHWCIGACLAQTQITQTFKALLTKGHLRRAKGPRGQLARLGPFPAHLVVEFDP
jgi:cytochrome P450